MRTASCDTCYYFVRELADRKQGSCHRKPPAIFLVGMRPGKSPQDDPVPVRITLWPEVAVGHWCGEHALEPERGNDA